MIKKYTKEILEEGYVKIEDLTKSTIYSIYLQTDIIGCRCWHIIIDNNFFIYNMSFFGLTLPDSHIIDYIKKKEKVKFRDKVINNIL